MNWTEELLEVYEKNRVQAGVIHYKKYKIGKEEQRIPYVLLPPFHTTVTAQVEIKSNGKRRTVKCRKGSGCREKHRDSGYRKVR